MLRAAPRGNLDLKLDSQGEVPVGVALFMKSPMFPRGGSARERATPSMLGSAAWQDLGHFGRPRANGCATAYIATKNRSARFTNDDYLRAVKSPVRLLRSSFGHGNPYPSNAVFVGHGSKWANPFKKADVDALRSEPDVEAAYQSGDGERPPRCSMSSI
jgi:hypothetical protein